MSGEGVHSSHNGACIGLGGFALSERQTQSFIELEMSFTVYWTIS